MTVHCALFSVTLCTFGQETAANDQNLGQLHSKLKTCLCDYRSHCHGNVCLNDDSKSQRRTLMAWLVILNRVDVRGGQSARDEWTFSDTASPPRLHGVHCLEDSVCRQSAGI